jgi:hypothetical protein
MLISWECMNLTKLEHSNPDQILRFLILVLMFQEQWVNNVKNIIILMMESKWEKKEKVSIFTSKEN